MNVNTLKDLVSQGLSSYEISKKLKKSPTTIRYWLNKEKLKTPQALKRQGNIICNTCGQIDKKQFYKNNKANCKKCFSIYVVTR